MSQLNRVRPVLVAVMVCGVLFGVSDVSHAQDRSRPSANAEANLQREVGHQLRLLPWLTVFDNIQFQVNGTSITLLGQVTQPRTKSEAEKAVKGVEGVTSVTNNIEVLPESPDDVRIRRAEYHAIYGDPNLEIYATGTEQPIHIIVKRDHVTLYGYVNTAMDKQIVQNRALSVPTVFGVDNQIQVQPRN